MPGIGSFLSLLTVPGDEPKLVAAQVRALTKQVPVLHAILSADAVAVCYTHYGIAPNWLTICPLAALLLTCFARMVVWARCFRWEPDTEEAVRRLRSTNRVSAILGSAFALWAVLLSRYGDDATQMHALFFLTITMIACVFCLLHLRSATWVIGLIAIPVTLYFAFNGNTVVAAAAVNFATVVSVLMFMQSVFYKDFRQQVRLSEENRRLANMDSLTGLPNRRFFFTELESRFAQARQRNTAFTVGIIDLDGFKPVNDAFGHAAGDDVLREVGRRLQHAMRDKGSVARIGGDEFGLLIEGDLDIARLGRDLCGAMQAPCVLRDTTAQIGASIGFAGHLDAADTAELLVERADYALYVAKAHLRGTAVIFSHEHASRLRSQSLIEQALRHADLEAEFDLVYQPIVETGADRIVAFEALARWTSPRLGRVSPGDFIPVAERAGLIQKLTPVLLRKALVVAATWPPEVRLSFNLSTCDIVSPDTVSRIAEMLAESGMEPERIILEVTETALMRDVGDATQSLIALKALGVSIALDDFGTGYSSLSYVHRLPLDKIKIDRSFTMDVCEDQACSNIVRSIVDLCRNLRITCVVEGVETVEQMLRLRALGCLTMQGYLFSRPVPAHDIPAMLAAAESEAGMQRLSPAAA